MKRIIALFLLIPIVSILFACVNQNSEGLDDCAFFSDETGIDKAFSIKEKKKTYNDEEIIILYVKNNTENEYYVTVNGSFIDESGVKTTKNEERNKTLFKCSEVCFIFQPEVAFDSFEYTFSSEKKEIISDGSLTISSNITVDLIPNPVDVHEGYDKIRATIMYNLRVQNDFPKAMMLKGTAIVFDNTGEIYAIERYNKSVASGVDYEVGEIVLNDVLWEEGMRTPDNLKGQLEIAFDYEYSDNAW